MNVANRQPVPDLRCRLPWGGRGGFSLVELLVVVAIILVLMAMLGAAVSAARGSQRRQATQALIARIDEVLKQQFATYPSRSVPASALTGSNKSAARAAYLRRLASAEMPDSWVDVQAIVNNTAGVPRTPAQSAYVGVFQAIRSRNAAWPTSDYADAECLFMIVMQSGLADCLDCGALGSSEKSDIDGDGAFEFLDAWGNPIRYVLWPAALELPPGSGAFFSTTAPFTSGAVAQAKGGTMRPLIFSGGPDGTNAIQVNGSGNLTAAGTLCGDPTGSTVGRPENAGAVDNITNLDAEAAR